MTRRPPRTAALPLLALLAALMTAGPALALRSDAEQPINIEADRVSLDDPRRITTYTGEVVMTQGSIEVHADKLVIHLGPTDEIERIEMTGTPATFRQLDDQGVEVYGEGLNMDYTARESLLVIREQALLRRGTNLFRGRRIDVDTLRSIVTAGDPAPASETERERVRITIEPRPRSPEPEGSP